MQSSFGPRAIGGWTQLEDSAERVRASHPGSAVQVSRLIEGQTGCDQVIPAIEGIQDFLSPLTVRAADQLEDIALVVLDRPRAAARSVNISLCVEDHVAVGARSIGAVELENSRAAPLAVDAATQLEDGAAPIETLLAEVAALPGRSIEVALSVEGETADGY